MDFDTTVADRAEQYLKQLDARGEGPHASECLRCYVDRMVAKHGCDNSTRFTAQWLEAVAMPGRRKLLRWFESIGGYCDCEVVMNALSDHWPAPVTTGDG